jgi:hypothetical protein
MRLFAYPFKHGRFPSARFAKGNKSVDMPSFKLKDTNYVVTPFGGPIDSDPKSELFAIYGYAVAACSRLEYIASMLALTLNNKAENPSLYTEDPDWRYPEMVRLIKKWLTRHPAYAHLDSPQNQTFFESLIMYAELRNALVHGFIEDYDARTKKITIQSIKREKGGAWRLRCMDYDIEVLHHLASQANLAAKHFNEVAKAVFDSAG